MPSNMHEPKIITEARLLNVSVCSDPLPHLEFTMTDVKSSPTLTEFLEARFAEDEAVAQAAVAALVCGYPDYQTYYDDDTENADRYIEHFAPARVLAELAAKQAILARLTPIYEETQVAWDLAMYVLLDLAQPYADHPDFDEAWRDPEYIEPFRTDAERGA